MTLLKGAVIGFGNIGQNLTTYINQHKQGEAQIVAACDIGESQLELAETTYGLGVTRDAQELVNMDIDFVLVTSTNAAHADQVVLAAEADRHVAQGHGLGDRYGFFTKRLHVKGDFALALHAQHVCVK